MIYTENDREIEGDRDEKGERHQGHMGMQRTLLSLSMSSPTN